MVRADEWAAGLRAADLAIFLDVDGTLLEFKTHPQDVVADGALRSLLERLRATAGGALALISGRTIADLDRIVAPLVIAAGGTHGAEMRWPDGRVAVAGADALALVRPSVRAFVDATDGLMLEDKGAALAIHFRQVPSLEHEVGRALDHAVIGHDLMVQRGKMVAEVKSTRSSKGEAIRCFVTTAPFAGRLPIFIGDDLTDEHGFASVNALGGVSVKVGEGETSAHHRLVDVDDVRNFLNKICQFA